METWPVGLLIANKHERGVVGLALGIVAAVRTRRAKFGAGNGEDRETNFPLDQKQQTRLSRILSSALRDNTVVTTATGGVDHDSNGRNR